MKSYYKAADGWWVDTRNRWYFKTSYDKYFRECFIIPTIVYISSSTNGKHDNWKQLHFKWLFFSFGITIEFHGNKTGSSVHSKTKPPKIPIYL